MKSSRLIFAALTLLVLASFNVTAQKLVGSGPVVSETVEMRDITNIGLGISANVYLTQGSSQSITLKGQKNIIDALEKSADGDSWEIEFPDGTRVNMSKKLEIHITLKTIESINIGGSGSVYGEEKFTNLDDVKMNIGGSGSITLDLEAEDVKCNIGGSGSIKLAGAADSFKANIGGSGSIKAIELQVRDAKVNAAGSGSVMIDVTDNLAATIVGSGGIKYKGNPKVNSSIMGSGRIRAY